MSQWCRSALCGHPLPALTDNWTHGAASRDTIAPISHTRPSPRSRSDYSFPVPLRVGGRVGLSTQYGHSHVVWTLVRNWCKCGQWVVAVDTQEVRYDGVVTTWGRQVYRWRDSSWSRSYHLDSGRQCQRSTSTSYVHVLCVVASHRCFLSVSSSSFNPLMGTLIPQSNEPLLYSNTVIDTLAVYGWAAISTQRGGACRARVAFLSISFSTERSFSIV